MSNAKQKQKQTHPALEEIPVQILAGKLAREANVPCSPAYEILAQKEITEAMDAQHGKGSQ